MAEETQKEEIATEVETVAVEAEVAGAEETVEERGIIESNLRSDLPEINAGDVVKVYQRIKEKAINDKAAKGKGKETKAKERIQVFEGQVLARKHGKGISATITVRKVIDGVGVEKIFPIHSPSIEKIEVLRSGKTRRSKLYYLRTAKGKRAKLKTVEDKKA